MAAILFKGNWVKYDHIFLNEIIKALNTHLYVWCSIVSLQWRHNERDGVWNHQPDDCLLIRLFRRRSKKTPKLRVTGLCEGNSPVICEFPAQRASNAENVPIWWRHHVLALSEFSSTAENATDAEVLTCTVPMLEGFLEGKTMDVISSGQVLFDKI